MIFLLLIRSHNHTLCGNPVLFCHGWRLVHDGNRMNDFSHDIQLLPLADLSYVLLIQIWGPGLELLRAVLAQEHRLEVVAELAIQDEALHLIVYEVFDEALRFGKGVAKLELHGYGVEVCNDLRATIRAGHRRVVLLDLIQVFLGDIDWMRVPKVIVDHDELFLFLAFEEPVAQALAFDEAADILGIRKHQIGLLSINP